MVKKLQKNQSSPAAHAALTGSVKDSAQQIWQAGLGAFTRAQAEGSKAFEALVKEGVTIQRKTQAAAEAGEVDAALGTWWEEFSLAGEEVRRDMLGELREHEHTRRRIAPAGTADETAQAGSAAPRKRRRRRKPAGAPPAPSSMAAASAL